jgi:hypothetical protein
MNAKPHKRIHLWPVLASVGLACMAFLVASIWSQPQPGQAASLYQQSTAAPGKPAQVTATPHPVVVKGPTPIPQEWKDNKDQTNGVVLGGVVLVMIIVGGTLSAIFRKDRYPKS